MLRAQNHIRIVAICCLLPRALQCQSFQPAVLYDSPDRVLQARVLTDTRGESKIRIENIRERRVLLTRHETSADGSHGYGVSQAAWTSDGKFFVVGLVSSGGHQPWAHPIWVYSRSANRILELAKRGMTCIGDFQLVSPNVLKAQFLEGPNAGLDSSRPITVRLDELFSR